jgi:hypothetical protein
MARRFQRLFFLCALAYLLVCATPSFAQGCSVCKNTAESAPQAQQRALKKGILTLVVPTTLILGGFGLVLYRNRH